MKEVIKRKIDSIAELYASQIDFPTGSYGLLSGTCGISLFLNEYSKVCGKEKYLLLAESHVESALDDVFNDPMPQGSFCNGISGALYLLSYFERQNVFKYNISCDVDEYLYSYLKFEIDNNHYDFLHGALGIAYCFLTRTHHNSYTNKVISETLLFLQSNLILDETKRTSKWISKNTKNEDEYNISLSHGMSSIVVFLLKMYQQAECYVKDGLKLMIENTVGYILMQEIDHNKYGSFFPYVAIESSKSISKSRLAWCYGDLGIATTLFQAGYILDRQDWIEKSLEILQFAASWRRDLKDNMVFDACFCHGTSGIGHIFYRMWCNTRIPEFKEAADYWFAETLKMARFEDGLEGFKIWNTLTHSYDNSYGLLEGVAGIGLALISYANETEPTWDECLLLS